MPDTKLSKYIITDLKVSEELRKLDAASADFTTRVLWMDENVVPGAFHMNTSWYLKSTDYLEDKSHTHDSDEIIGFFGSDPANPNDLGGEVEFWLEDEKHILTRTCMIFAPAGMKHCPLRILRVDRPIFHFTISPGSQYIRK